MAHYVYILQSLKDKGYYVGETKDVVARIAFHNKGLQRSTKNRTPFQILLVEEYENRSIALKREKVIKSWKGGMAFKKLIEGM
jgi:putative endonuclease